MALGGFECTLLALMRNCPTCWGKTAPTWIGRYPAQTAVALKAAWVSVFSADGSIPHQRLHWDKRYYHVLANLEAKGLISVTKEKNSYQIALTELGQSRAKRLLGLPSFEPIVDLMKDVKRAFGARSGSSLKQMI